MIENYINKVINGDCVNVMSELPEGSVDLIVTSPPYIFTTQNLSDTHHWVSTTNLASNESSVIAKKVFGN